MSARKAELRITRTKAITVLLAEDYTVIREGLHCLLDREPGIRVVGSVGDGASAVREASRLHPSVVVMGITMPGVNGIEATRLLGSRHPDIKVLILSIHASPVIVRQAIDAGALGYLVKDTNSEELVRAVRSVAGGNRYIGQGLAQIAFDLDRTARARHPPLEILTATELNILRLVAEGQTNPQIAALVGLSPRTVETYRLRIMHKLNLNHLPALVRYAIRHGVVPLD
jgi:DNA-binding NarL/FixJ family response regulator